MFTLIGLHDWAMLTKAFPNNVKENESMIYYNEGLESLKSVISLYDVGGFTSYDLGHITYDKTQVNTRLSCSSHQTASLFKFNKT